jgi:phosphatidylglycerol---prolipoprotein diacylglyceryl transferase
MMLNFITFPDWIKPEIIPPLPVRWYALMYIIAFTITYLLFNYQVKQRKLDIKKDDIANVFLCGIIGLIIGARLFSVIIYDPRGMFIRNPLTAFLPVDFENGQCTFTGFQGMSYHGGAIGCTLGVIIYCRIKKLSILDWCDMIIAGVPLGYFFGRIGNFINAELYGRVTTLPWGMIFPHAELSAKDSWVVETANKLGIASMGKTEINLPRHPSQLYEAFFEGIVIWLIMFFLLRKKKPFNGFMVGSYFILYGIIRFFLEYLRQPDFGIGFPIKFIDVDNPIYRFITPWNFTTGQILCFLMIVGGTISLLAFKKFHDYKLSSDTPQKLDMKKLKKKIK